MEQGRGEVRIMTVHGAKGLEAPIVILPDTTTSADSKTANLIFLAAGTANARVPLWLAPKSFASPRIQALKDKEKRQQTAEYQRLLYVAMTRARDELYVCGYSGAKAVKEHCWYKTVRDGLEQDIARVVIEAPPGFRLGAPPSFTASGEVPKTGVIALPDWIGRSIDMGPPAGPVAQSPRQPRGPERVARGILIHRILQQLPELAPAGWNGHIEQSVARAGAETELATEIIALIAQPDIAELLSPEGLSEVPLMVEFAGLAPQRRRIDRLVPAPRGFLIVDYKTDREVPQSIAACDPDYIRQMAIYRDALRLLHPGQPLRLALLWTAAPRLMPIPDSAMDGLS